MADEYFSRDQLRFIDAFVSMPLDAVARGKGPLAKAGVRDAGAAAEKAGLHNALGHEFLAMPHVAEEIRYRLENKRGPNNITQDKLERMAYRVAIRCMQVVPVIDRAGRETGEYKFLPNAAISAMRLIADMKGFLDPRLRQQVNVINNTVSMTVADFVPLMKEAMRVISDQGIEMIADGRPPVVMEQGHADLPGDSHFRDLSEAELPGDRAEVDPDVTLSVKNVQEFLNSMKKKEIVILPS